MARANVLLNTFTSGEISPRLHARTNTPVYQSGCKVLENYLVLAEGGADGRRGFRFVESTKVPAKTARLLPFIFSTIQAYMLEAGDSYVRFYKDGVRILDTPELVTNGTFDTGITGWTVLDDTATWAAGTQSLILWCGPLGGDGLAAVEQAVTVTPAVAHRLRVSVFPSGLGSTQLVLRVGTTSGGQEVVADTSYGDGTHEVTFTPGVSPVYVGLRQVGGSPAGIRMDNVSVQLTAAAPVEVVTPYVESDLKDLQWTQSADTLFLVHPKHAPRRLLRASHTSWALQVIEFFDGPYLPGNSRTDWTLVADATGPNVTLTAAGAGFAPFQAGHVGSTWSLTFGTVTKPVRILTVADATHATGLVVDRIDDNGLAGFVLVGGSLGAGFGTPTSTWAEGAWSDVRGWPAAIAFFEQRLWFGYTDRQPQTFWGTVNAEPTNMAKAEPDSPAAGDGAVTFTLASGQVNAIRWLAGSPTALIIGTIGGEHAATGGPDQAITAANIKVRPATTRGARRDRALPPVQIDRTTLLVSRTGRVLHALEFSLDLESYVAPNISRRSAHIVGPRGVSLIALVYQAEPDPVLWGLRSDGVLVALTIERDEEVLGWSRHPVAGTTAGAAVVESIAVIPNTGGTADELWAIVRRTVNGQTRRDVERLDPDQAVFLDAHLTYAGAETSTLAGLGHLEGETVQIVGNGAVYPDQVVTGGAITVDPPVTEAAVGLHPGATLTTLPIDAGNPAGTAKGRRKSVSEVVVSLHESLGLEITTSAEGAEPQVIPFRRAADPMGVPVPVFTGDKVVETLGWDFTGSVTIRRTQPLPSTILGVTVTTTVGEG